MSFQVTQNQKPVDESKLLEIEGDYDFNFPQQYKDFLLQFNGGRILPRNFTFGDGNYDGSRIDRFLAVYEGAYDNFENYLRIYKVDAQRLPDNLIPIAHDDGGNLICISASGEDVGALYFWDHEYESDEDEENLFLIAPTFNEFLTSLT